ncbi:Bug family tripartite tricarboxylate transporter substrate binding protein [Ottowia thiooxydans]|uniref:Bug family tripartite tricarboxylate transporter substrate binding protein n=1 Tax=Ottowia thiooxydans TaxID=219182 RepID=UPI00041D167B|nr:tripartite tricarboxylate transporter substrate binding protein [Ottowia thiooxydans]
MNLLSRMVSSCVLAGCALVAAAQSSFPSKPLRIIVPFTPGSGTDTAARYYAEPLGKLLGQPVVVENRPGANGAIGVMTLKNAPADGYTLLMASNSPITVNPLTEKSLAYDPFNDLRPISGLSRSMSVYLVPVSSPYKTLQEFTEAARSGPHALNIATYSAGQILANAWLSQLSGAKLQNVSYKGQTQIMTDLEGGHIDAALVDISGAVTHIKAGKVRALGVTSDKRHFQVPEVPTVQEAGFPEYLYLTWLSVYAAKHTPEPVAAVLENAMQKILDTDYARGYQAKFGGGSLMPLTAAQQAAFQKEEYDRLKSIADKVGIKPQ